MYLAYLEPPHLIGGVALVVVAMACLSVRSYFRNRRRRERERQARERTEKDSNDN